MHLDHLQSECSDTTNATIQAGTKRQVRLKNAKKGGDG